MKVLLEGLRFPEGPAFAPDGSLWCVELNGGAMVESGGRRVETGGRPNGLTFDADGAAVFCDSGQNAIRRWSGGFETMAANLFGPNDLCFDPAGNLLFTCPGDSRRQPTGYVAALRTDGTLDRVGSAMYFPNGLALNGSTLVVAETYRHRLWRGLWDGSKWHNAAPWVEAGGPIGPDGMAFDSAGVLWVAIYGQSVVKAVSPSGEILRELPVEGRNPTNVAFDPSGKLGLVVTEAERGRLLSFPEVRL
jgi:gluconolactonase